MNNTKLKCVVLEIYNRKNNIYTIGKKIAKNAINFTISKIKLLRFFLAISISTSVLYFLMYKEIKLTTIPAITVVINNKECCISVFSIAMVVFVFIVFLITPKLEKLINNLKLTK